MDFAHFIAPVSVDAFMTETYGRRPLHISGDGSPRRELLSLKRLEQLMTIQPHWTEQNLKLIINSRPVRGEHYLDADTRRADPAKVQLFMRMGASFVADHLEDIDPAIRDAVAMLSRQFSGIGGANAYCSFKDVQAFNSHCDVHEVFAVQLEGEKIWQIYENRADCPIEPLQGEGAQAMIDQAKGRVMMTVRMKAGDLLYIPRGYFHDALAASDLSLHLTFGLAPLTGRYLFRLLEEIATREPAFRAYLADGQADPGVLRDQLGRLADEIGKIARSPLFEALLTGRQRATTTAPLSLDLTDRAKPDYFARTEQGGAVVWDPAGAALRSGRGDQPLGVLIEPAEWALEQNLFSRLQLRAQFPWLTNVEAVQLVDTVLKAGLFTPCDPPL